MKTSAKVISLRKKKFKKKYGKILNNYKYFIMIVAIPLVLAMIISLDKMLNR